LDIKRKYLPSLSNPAAKPTGFLKVKPNNFRSKLLSSTIEKVLEVGTFIFYA